MFSEKNDIVNSSEWANLINENALDEFPIGTNKGMTYEEIYGPETAALLRLSRSESNKQRKGRYSEETIEKLRKPRPAISGNKNPMFGKTHSKEAKHKISETSKTDFGQMS